MDTRLFCVTSNTVIDPGKRNDEARRSDTGNIQADQDAGFVAVRQCDNEDRADNVRNEPSCSDVSSVVWPSLEG